jgi:hypothetical protein
VQDSATETRHLRRAPVQVRPRETIKISVSRCGRAALNRDGFFLPRINTHFTEFKAKSVEIGEIRGELPNDQDLACVMLIYTAVTA